MYRKMEKQNIKKSKERVIGETYLHISTHGFRIQNTKIYSKSKNYKPVRSISVWRSLCRMIFLESVSSSILCNFLFISLTSELFESWLRVFRSFRNDTSSFGCPAKLGEWGFPNPSGFSRIKFSMSSPFSVTSRRRRLFSDSSCKI